MPYLLLDPTDDYAARMMRFLGGRGLDAVLLFSSPGHRALWERDWRDELEGRVVGEEVVAEDEVGALAGRLRDEFAGDLSGLVVWDERHVLLAAEVAAALGLDWNSPAVIERFRDKALLKRWLRENGPADLRLNRARTVSDEGEALAFWDEVGGERAVVKPSAGAGSMSVFFAEDPESLLRACRAVFERGLGEVLLEEWIGGTEYAVNGIADRRGEALVTEVWRYDRRDSHGERNLYYETIQVRTRDPAFGAAAEYAARVVGALGLRRSPFHLELKIDERGPCLIECGARFAGGHQPVLGSLLHGRSFFELAACHFLAAFDGAPHDVDFAHYDAHAARIVSGIQEEEIEVIRAVVGLDEVRRLPSFHGTGMLRRPGLRAPVSRDVGTKAWEVLLFHEDEEQVARDAAAARALLRYV